MLGRLLCESQGLSSARCPNRSCAVHVEVCLDLTSLLLKQHRKEESRAEHPAKAGQKPGARAWPEFLRGMTVFRHQVTPDDDVPVLYLSQPPVDVLFFRIRLGVSENAVEECRVRFVLPVVLERVDVRLVQLGSAWFGRRWHGSNMPGGGGFRHRQPFRENFCHTHKNLSHPWREKCA